MNVHVALYKFKESASAEDIAEALALIEGLEAKVPGILEISTGLNTSKYSEGYTYVILVRGENQAAIDAYRAHPEHAVAAAKLDAMEEKGVGVDLETK